MRLEEEVLGLQVTMHDILRVAIIERLEDLAEDYGSLVLLKELCLDDPIE